MTEFGPFVAESVSLERGKPGAFCVEASAGTGKTYSITGLVLRLVCEENLPLDEILVVTFTRAAAAELRGRIGDRLAAAQADLERAERFASSHAAVWREFLNGDAGAAEAVKNAKVFSDDFVARWVRSALGGPAAAKAAETMDAWLERIRRARQRVDAATFATIHSFCQRMLEWHAFESNQPLGIAFAEDEAKLREEIANDLWGELVEGLPEDLIAWSGLSPDSWKTAIEKALRDQDAVLAPGSMDVDQTRSTGWEAALTTTAAEAETALLDLRDPEDRDGLFEWLHVLFSKGDANQVSASRGLRKVPSNEPVGNYRARQDRRVELMASMPERSLISSELLAGVVRLFERVRDDGIVTAIMSRQQANVTADGWHAHPWSQRLGDLADGPGNPDRVEERLVLAACHEARRRYAARLAERSEVTFDDLVTRLADRVQAEAEENGPGVGPLTSAIRERFKAALIDEFQDTDNAQWTLFEKIFLDSPDHRIFLIGDPKQAIYRFRSADIHTYLRARSRVHVVARERLAAQGITGDALDRVGLYTMTRNFRSDAALIVTLNRFMGALHAEGRTAKGEATPADVPRTLNAPVTCSRSPGTAVRGFFDRRDDTTGTGIDYILVDWQKPTPREGEDCVLLEAPGSGLRVDGAPPDDLLPWTAQPLVFRPVAVPLPEDEQGTGGGPQLEKNEDCKRELPHVVAADIRRLLGSGTRIVAGTEEAGDDGTQGRLVSPGDIAVLVHAWKMGHAIAARLRSHGIPAVIMAGEVVWKCDEAEDLAVLLAALLNPRHTGGVVAALSTPLLSVAPEHLTAFTGEDTDLPEQWMDTLGQLARTWEKHGLLRMVSALLDLRVDPGSGRPAETRAIDARLAPTRREALLQATDGERRLTNLLQLAELLHAECSGRFLGPQGQLDTLRARMVEDGKDANSPDDPRKQRLDTDDQAVRITTVHGSKGLEYPIVFLPGFDAKGVQSRSFSAPVTVPEAPRPAGDEVEGERAAGARSPAEPRRNILYATKSIMEAAAGEKPQPKERDEHESEEESRRLLYVGLTRAKHQVVLYVRDWTDSGRVTNAAELDKLGSAETKTPLGRLLASTPRVHALATSEDALATAGKEAAAARGDQDTRVLIGDLCLSLGEAVNPIGETIFKVPRTRIDLPLRRFPPWRPPGEKDAEDRPALGVADIRIPREHFYSASYRQGSFSALAKGAAHGPAGESVGPDATDHDAEGASPSDPLLADAVEDSMRDRPGMDEPLVDTAEDSDPGETHEDQEASTDLLFESTRIVGRDFGTAIHELLEKADFAAPVSAAEQNAARPGPTDSLHDATTRAVRRFGFQLDAAAVHTLATDVHTFLNAPLGGPLGSTSLAHIPRTLRIDELEFLLPVPENLTHDRLVAAFKAGPPPGEGTSWATAPGSWQLWLDEVDRLRFDEFNGFLTGFVDLVFATPDTPARLYILDYKTNKLHRREMKPDAATACYEQPALLQPMIQSRYVLQYHLYQVALFRMLRTRLGASFDWDIHMGGAWYPFLRGVQPAAAAVDGTALRRGVFHDRPPRERIEALDAIFGPVRITEGTRGATSAHTAQGGTP